MNFIFFMNPIIKGLSKGKILNQIVALVMKIAAVLMALNSLWVFYKSFGPFEYFNFGQKVVYFLFSNLFILVTAYIVFQILWIRSEDIIKDESEDYKAIQISKYLLKGIGEAFAATVLIGGFCGMFLTWLIEGYRAAGARIPYLPDFSLGFDNKFMLGLNTFISAIIGATLIIFFFYLIAETILVQIGIYMNTRELKSKTPENN